MKKKIAVIVCLVLALALVGLLVFQSAYRKITVVSGKQFVDECPRFARPGQEVTVTTAVIDDGEIYVNGTDGRYVRPGVYVFTMPDEDVQLKINVVANPNGA
ncbi:MAG: hypothetical protein IJT62_07030 [Oscillospiraceae bacterium]|nr:hypothetical protein [Oscillospiraceae bacterium]